MEFRMKRHFWAASLQNVASALDGISMELACPVLRCEPPESTILDEGVCFLHDSKATARLLQGSLCFDVEFAKQSDPRFYCPFNVEEYMWVDEDLQGQGIYGTNMLCKYSSLLV